MRSTEASASPAKEGAVRRTSGDDVLLDQLAEPREGQLDVLLALRAHLLVRLLDRGAARLGGPVVRHAEEGVGDLFAAAGQVAVQRLALAAGAVVGVERLEPADEVV